MKKYKVIAVHFTNKCNLRCPFCYKKQDDSIKPKSFKFFIDLVPYLSELTDQIALGGGEPLMFPHFIKAFGEECKKYDLILNITSNGYFSLSPNIQKLITMLSVSFDKYKYNYNIKRYEKALSKYKDVRLGSNLLISNELFNPPSNFYSIVKYLLSNSIVERVFALYPKDWEYVPILRHREVYQLLTKEFEHFYVDDLTYKILKEGNYIHWNKPCHYGKDLISIHEDGGVTGCSFDKTPLFIMNKPEDIMKIKDIKITPRLSCPHLSMISRR